MAPRGHKPSVRMEVTMVGEEEDPSTGLSLRKMRCLVKNLSGRDRTLRLLLDPREGGEGEERGAGGQGSHAFVEACVPVGLVRANSTRAVTCRLAPLVDTEQIFLPALWGRMRLEDDEGKVYAIAGDSE